MELLPSGVGDIAQLGKWFSWEGACFMCTRSWIRSPALGGEEEGQKFKVILVYICSEMVMHENRLVFIHTFYQNWEIC